MEFQVCIDPGHGPGSVNKSPDGRYEEQEFAMDVSQRVAAILRGHGVDVLLTRSKDEFPSLGERCRIANAHPEIRLFVSIHSNAMGGGGWQTPSGHMIFTSAPGENEDRNRAARAILNSLEQAGIPLRKSCLQNQKFTVLTDTSAPAVLLEHGFHTNLEEVEMLLDPAFRQKLAQADAQGILDFLGINASQPNQDRDRVKARFGLEEQTIDYLEDYKYGKELLSKLAEGGKT
ncbi:MAG: hypothetical protein H6Q61_1018 [Firmicutes bacterium]|nr:hypothetical protein [Bacillota bacterium]